MMPKARHLALFLILGGLVGGCSSPEDDGTLEAAGSGGAVAEPAAGGDGQGGEDGIYPPGGTTSGGAAGTTGDGGAEAPDRGEDGGAEEPPLDDDAGEATGTGGDVAACDEDTPVQLFLSPDDSNSMSSPVQVREAVLGSFSELPYVAIRTWEFLNYYTFDYPAADPGTLNLTTALAHDDGMADGEYLLQIGVSSEAIDNAERAPLNITLVLDTSGSMTGPPMDMLKASCRAIAASLNEGDTISMVTWNTQNAVILGGYTVDGPNDAFLVEKIDELGAGGGTDLHGGLVAGYNLAHEVYDNERLNRIVLISDGGANVGVTDADLIADEAGANDGDGIYMVGVGVGTASSYNDHLMDTVTDLGKGASVFIASQDEADKVFHDDFVNTLAVAARDVQVELDLPPGFEIVRFSGEEFSSDPTEIEPQHIAPNDAMVFHQRIETCAPDLIDETTSLTITARYKDAVTFEPREVSIETTFAELLEADDTQLRKGAAVFEYAEALKAYRKAGTQDEQGQALAPAFAALETAEAALEGDADLAEIRSVLESL